MIAQVKGCKAPYPVRECLPGSAGAGRSAAAGLCALSQKSARGGFTRAPLALELSGSTAWPGTQTPQSWPGFVLLRCASHSGRCLPAAAGRAQGGKALTVFGLLQAARCPLPGRCSCGHSYPSAGKHPPPGWRSALPADPPGRQILLRTVHKAQPGQGGSGRWSREYRRLHRGHLMRQMQWQASWPDGRPCRASAAAHRTSGATRASAGGSLSNEMCILKATTPCFAKLGRVCAPCIPLMHRVAFYTRLGSYENRQSTPVIWP